MNENEPARRSYNYWVLFGSDGDQYEAIGRPFWHECTVTHPVRQYPHGRQPETGYLISHPEHTPIFVTEDALTLRILERRS